MRRSRSITLVLLGGGIILAGCGEDARTRACREATAAQRPDASQICARSETRSTRSGAYFGSWYYGRNASQAAGLVSRRSNTSSASGSGVVSRGASTGAVSRGGFGSRGASGG